MQNLIKNSRVVNWLYRTTGSLVIRILGLFVKTNQKRILFSSGMGKGIFDSPLDLYNAMKSDPFFSDYEMIWAVKEPSKFDKDYKVVKVDTPAYFMTALSSRIWITSINIERGLKFKKKETYYVNTWHGIPLKYIGMDVKARKDYDFSHIDLFICSGSYEEEIYKKAFNLQKNQLLCSGLPRNNSLLEIDKEQQIVLKKELFEELSVENYENKKIVLFAPTWKDYSYERLNLELLAKQLGDEYLILLKSHPLEVWNNHSSLVYDVTTLMDLSSLMAISDVLISDYSSVMIDYALLKKPIYAYVPDFDDYHRLRGLYVSKELIAPNYCVSVEELSSSIVSIDYNLETQKSTTYYNCFINSNADASVALITNKIKENIGGM